MADKLIMEYVNIAGDDLCSVYGCDRCPGFVKSAYGGLGGLVFCSHDCHEAKRETDIQ
jgi:hypothetical protein